MSTLRFLLLIGIFQLVVSAHQSYITFPFERVENKTHTAHNMQIQINQYPYQIDLNLQGEKDYFISLNATALIKSPTSSPDYRKHPDTVYGVLNYIGNERADIRCTLFQQLTSNLYYIVRDLLPKQIWIDLKNAEQVNIKRSELSEGAVNLAAAKASPFLKSLRKYSTFVREQIVSFRLKNDNKMGQLYVGIFPLQELLLPGGYSQVNMYNDQSKGWKIKIAGIKLKHLIGENQQSTETTLFSIETRFALSLSEKTLQIPKPVGQALQTMLEGCRMTQVSTQKLLVCREASVAIYSSFAISLSIPNTNTPLDFRFADLLRQTKGGHAIFNIRQGDDENYHIGSTILRQYLVGFDLDKAVFSFGKKRPDQWIDRFLLAKVFLAGNIIVFTFSVLVLSIAHRLNYAPQSEQTAQASSDKEEKRLYTASRASGYQMAEISQETARDMQD